MQINNRSAVRTLIKTRLLKNGKIQIYTHSYLHIFKYDNNINSVLNPFTTSVRLCALCKFKERLISYRLYAIDIVSIRIFNNYFFKIKNHKNLQLLIRKKYRL